MTDWKPKLPVTRSLVERILADQYPELELAQLTHIAAGWSHDVWRCNDTLLRFPHQQYASASATTLTALEQLSKLLPIQIPVVARVGQPTPTYPASFAAYRWIPGEMPHTLPLTDRDRSAIATPLAEVLRALHSVPTEAAKEWGVPITDKAGELALRAIRAQERATQLASTPYAQLASMSATALTSPPVDCPASDYRLVHGDLHAGQVLLGPALQLVGILDWDDVRIGDPAYDLMMVYSFLPATTANKFWQTYGEFPGKVRAKHLALSYGLAFLAQAVSEGDVPMASEAAWGLKNALVSIA
jgi:aminoglycoside phosphotransferase (APT) family kinase protein